MNCKRILSLVLSVLICLAAMPFGVFADGVTTSAIAKIGEVEYASLAEAFAAAKEAMSSNF